MNELHRQAYLDAMGVDSYFPRATLAGALASPICLLPEVTSTHPESAVVAGANVPLSRPVTGTAAKDVMASIGLLDTSKLKAARPQLAVQTVEPVITGKQAVPHFSLMVLASAHFVLIAENIAGQQAQDYQQMLANITLALGDRQQPVFLPFSWPMINSAAVDQSAAVARMALAAFLKEHVANRTAVIFGPAAQYLQLEDTIGQLTNVPSLGCPALITACAAKAYAQPECKRELWQHLAPLRLAL
ncbi:hypothetical protein [Dasania marina]|uniref:hypothetical protein n=1 Tax=Dasania marina TaxID=471499 RepID=UPI0030D8F1B3|tara:strand:+ start:3014 stop:3748 length:735 start_codon:yes stop_codon:yes gene_type:complete